MRRVAEEDVRRLDGFVIVLFAVDHAGDFFGKTFLQDAEVRRFFVLFNQRLDLLAAEGGEDLNVAFRIVVAHVQPELVELIRAGVFLAKPDIAALGLAELAAVGFRDERAREGESGLAVHLTHQLDTRGDVAPLVRTAHLHQAVLVLVQIDEVVALQQLVGELGKRHSLRELAVEALLHAVLGHHVIDGDQFAYIAREIKESVVLHPVVVVHQLGCIGFVAVEIQEVLQLLTDARYVMAQRLFRQQVARGGLAARVADHTGCTA